MRWFKHIATTHQAEDGAAIIDRMGAEGYGVWWIILEVIASQMDSTSKCSANYSAKKWGSFCGFSAKKFQKFAEKLTEFSAISVRKNGEFLEIECPNLLKYRDEYSKKSGQSPDKLRTKIQRQNTETDTEKNIKPLSDKSDALSAQDQVVVDVILKDESTFHVTQYDIDDWTQTFPRVNVVETLAKIRNTCLRSPSKRKTNGEIRRHIYNCLKMVNQRAEEFERIWKRYPEKVGKKAAEKFFRSSVQTEDDLRDIHQALDNYVATLDSNPDRPPQNGSTWFNNWRDWINKEVQLPRQRSPAIHGADERRRQSNYEAARQFVEGD